MFESLLCLALQSRVISLETHTHHLLHTHCSQRGQTRGWRGSLTIYRMQVKCSVQLFIPPVLEKLGNCDWSNVCAHSQWALCPCSVHWTVPAHVCEHRTSPATARVQQRALGQGDSGGKQWGQPARQGAASTAWTSTGTSAPSVCTAGKGNVGLGSSELENGTEGRDGRAGSTVCFPNWRHITKAPWFFSEEKK